VASRFAVDRAAQDAFAAASHAKAAAAQAAGKFKVSQHTHYPCITHIAQLVHA
jgi:acetyl-CoA acyltransferase